MQNPMFVLNKHSYLYSRYYYYLLFLLHLLTSPVGHIEGYGSACLEMSTTCVMHLSFNSQLYTVAQCLHAHPGGHLNRRHK